MPDGVREIIEAVDRLGDGWFTMMTALDALHLSLDGVGEDRTNCPPGLPLLQVNPRPTCRDQRGVA